jgi:hypothetical protein
LGGAAVAFRMGRGLFVVTEAFLFLVLARAPNGFHLTAPSENLVSLLIAHSRCTEQLEPA